MPDSFYPAFAAFVIMILLDSARRRELRAAAHHLHPVVSIAAKGLTEAVLVEIERALQAHELIKVKTAGADRAQREEWMTQICTRLQCAPVQHIGNLLVLWRERREEPVFEQLRAAAQDAPAASANDKAAQSKSARAFAARARRTAQMARAKTLAERNRRRGIKHASPHH